MADIVRAPTWVTWLDGMDYWLTDGLEDLVLELELELGLVDVPGPGPALKCKLGYTRAGHK